MNIGYELRTTLDKGEGVFATKNFKIGDTVMIGLIEKTFETNHSHASQIAKNIFAQHKGLISKVNHSCNPNCGIRVNETKGHDFVCMTEIHENEEITFDYAMRNYTIDHFGDNCMCGSENCRHKITGWKDLSIQRKKDYVGFVAPYLLDIDSEIV